MVETQILIVEDEVIVAEDVRRRLENIGYNVPSIASSGEDAIEKVGVNNPDLVLMDIMLGGGMDGIETADQIRLRFNIPVVYLTAYSDDQILYRAKITEPYGYIIKPFKERELQINIEIALYKHRMEKKMKESREWYRTTLKSISDAVIGTDQKGCVLFMNPAAEYITDWSLNEAKDRPLKEIFNIISEKPASVRSQTILINRKKMKIPVDSSSDTIKDDKGNIIGIVIVFRKIPE